MRQVCRLVNTMLCTCRSKQYTSGGGPFLNEGREATTRSDVLPGQILLSLSFGIWGPKGYPRLISQRIKANTARPSRISHSSVYQATANIHLPHTDPAPRYRAAKNSKTICVHWNEPFEISRGLGSNVRSILRARIPSSSAPFRITCDFVVLCLNQWQTAGLRPAPNCSPTVSILLCAGRGETGRVLPRPVE